MLTYRTLTASDIPAASELLAQAFADYEYVTVCMDRPEQRLRFLRSFQKVRCSISSERGGFLGAFMDGELVAVALLDSPGTGDPTLSNYLRHGGVAIITAAKGRLLRVMSLDRRANRPIHELKTPYWKLAFLAVTPQHKRRGIGSAFFREGILPYVREHGGGLLTLVTNNRENCAFYEKNGCENFHHSTLMVGRRSLGNWCYRIEV